MLQARLQPVANEAHCAHGKHGSGGLFLPSGCLHPHCVVTLQPTPVRRGLQVTPWTFCSAASRSEPPSRRRLGTTRTYFPSRHCCGPWACPSVGQLGSPLPANGVQARTAVMRRWCLGGMAAGGPPLRVAPVGCLATSRSPCHRHRLLTIFYFCLHIMPILGGHVGL